MNNWGFGALMGTQDTGFTKALQKECFKSRNDRVSINGPISSMEAMFMSHFPYYGICRGRIVNPSDKETSEIELELSSKLCDEMEESMGTLDFGIETIMLAMTDDRIMLGYIEEVECRDDIVTKTLEINKTVVDKFNEQYSSLTTEEMNNYMEYFLK